ncbi:MAG TPA: CRISPR-associated endonuclease Cas2, partial [Clostridiales bacterium]|nr:CRISPR-associated endonuclease Cas2 [Clostridiales bacterium]
SDAEKRNYRQFHKFLIKNGFLMLQNSVYTKIVLNASVLDSVREIVYK